MSSILDKTGTRYFYINGEIPGNEFSKISNLIRLKEKDINQKTKILFRNYDTITDNINIEQIFHYIPNNPTILYSTVSTNTDKIIKLLENKQYVEYVHPDFNPLGKKLTFYTFGHIVSDQDQNSKETIVNLIEESNIPQQEERKEILACVYIVNDDGKGKTKPYAIIINPNKEKQSFIEKENDEMKNIKRILETFTTNENE